MGNGPSKQQRAEPLPSPGLVILDGHAAEGRKMLTFKRTRFRRIKKKVTIRCGGKIVYTVTDQPFGISGKGYRQKDIHEINGKKKKLIATIGLDLGLNVSRCTCYAAKSKTVLFTLGRGENNTLIATPCDPVETAVEDPELSVSFDGGVVRCGRYRVGQFLEKGVGVDPGIDQVLLIAMKVMMRTIKRIKRWGVGTAKYVAPGGGTTGKVLTYTVQKLSDDADGKRIKGKDGDDSAYGFMGTGLSKEQVQQRVQDEALSRGKAQAKKQNKKRQDKRNGITPSKPVGGKPKRRQEPTKAEMKAHIKKQAKADFMRQVQKRRPKQKTDEEDDDD